MSAVLKPSAPPGAVPVSTLASFYRGILPTEGSYAIFLGATKQHIWCDSIDELVAATQGLVDTQGIYFAVSSFQEPTTRSASNALFSRAFYFDIDAGEAKIAKIKAQIATGARTPAALDAIYPTQKAAIAALVGWCQDNNLPPTYVVSSGAGLHVYLGLDADVPIAEWKPVAEALKRKALADGLRIDAVVTGDAARILRPIGTMHHSGERVRVLRALPVRYSMSHMSALVADYIERPAAKRERRLIDDVVSNDFADRPPASLSKIVAACAAVGAAAKAKGDVGEPYWRAMLGVIKFCDDPDKNAHAFSEGHADYDRVATQAKLDKWQGGPTLCATFEAENPQACAGCEHRGKTKSPIGLGYEVTQAGADSGESSPDLQHALDRMNEHNFVAPDGAGRAAIHQLQADPETGAARLVVLSRAELLLAHENQCVTVPKPGGGTQRIPIAQWWLRHPQRRQYPGGVALIPEGPVPAGVYNQYNGFSVAPTAGDVSVMLAHIDMLCSGVQELIAYVIGWLAFCIQHPGQRPEVAVVFQGDEGTGKGTLLRLMVQIFGSHGLHITQNSHLVGHFNAHLRWALFVFVDEGYWAGDKAAEGVLKGIVTEPTLTIEVKGRDVFSAKNRISLCMATNHAYAVPSGANARRWLVVPVPSAKVRDFGYFSALNNWIDQGGAGAWLHYLQGYDLSGFNVRAVPSTAALDRQKIESLPPLDRWILEALEQGTELTRGDEWKDDGSTVVCAAAVGSFADYCKRAGGRWGQADARVIGTRLDGLYACGPSRAVQDGARRAKAWRLPGLEQARALTAKAFGLHHHVWGT